MIFKQTDIVSDAIKMLSIITSKSFVYDCFCMYACDMT